MLKKIRKLSNKQRVFSGQKLKEIAFPLGGIGTGTISLGGRGEFKDWEIFNRPGKGVNLPYTFFSLWAKQQGGKAVARVLERQYLPPFNGESGLPVASAPGLPRFREVYFIGSYPFAKLIFLDNDVPVEVSLNAFNPFIPLDSDSSGLPVAILHYQLKNKTQKKVKATVVGSLFNPIGYDGDISISNNGCHPNLGKNINRLVTQEDACGILMSSSKYSQNHPLFGSMAIVSNWNGEITYVTRWRIGDWWDHIHRFWEDLSADGKLSNCNDQEPTDDGRSDIASLGLCGTLAPGELLNFTFIIAWHFPNRTNYWDKEDAVKGKILGNYYTTKFTDAWDAAIFTIKNLDRLEEGTKLFHKTLFSSTLPPYVLDAASSQLSTLRTQTCIRLPDGSFHGFEGCLDKRGCCPMNCTHVWNYEQALAFLFPELERSMRRTDFLINVRADGKMDFRTKLPLGITRFEFDPAADGQMGTIMRLYRDWKFSGDYEFLKELWPKAVLALEYAWKRWDKDCDGVMEDWQHNTYDIEFLGPNTMIGTLYLGALRAAEKMARALGDNTKADQYHKLFEKGCKKYDRLTWNGEYYIQKYDPVKAPKYQYGTGCLSDQLLGEWLGRVLGIGPFLPLAHIKKALGSIFHYNWRNSFSSHANPQRAFVSGEEKGLLLCSWPKGRRPALPFVYSDEVWTGVEYQVASHLIYEGMVDEGLVIVKGVRKRYDGERRNPWDECECGHHYVRAMSSWALILALSGYDYSAIEKSIVFAPKMNQKNFSVFWSAGSGWGSYQQRRKKNIQTMTLRVLWGKVQIERFGFQFANRQCRKISTTVDSKKVYAKLEQDKIFWAAFGEPIELKAGQTLTIKASCS